MQLLNEILATLPSGEVLQVCIGLHWTAVVVDAGGGPRCGLASTLSGGHHHRGEPDVPQAGSLKSMPALDLARLVLPCESGAARPTQASLGMATVNALLPPEPQSWKEANAEMILAAHGAGKRVVVVGHFPFVERLRPLVGELLVLEQQPGLGDLPAEAAAEVLPEAQVVAITAMTLFNYTLQELLDLCQRQALVMLLGPSAPLSPVLFDYGVQVISGTLVTAIEPVLRVISQGGDFRQVHRAGARLVNMVGPGVAL